MKRKSAINLKRRLARINEFQDKELRKLSAREKLCQLNAIICLARGMKLDFGEDAESGKVRKRWISLKRPDS